MRDLKPKILFVDDEELARKTFERIAEKEFRVLTAESVEGAIDVLSKEHEDIGVLLSDQRMPGGLGVELLEHCRKHYPGITRMLTTAYSDLDDAIAAVNRGEIIRYIEKPWGNIDGLLIDLRVAMSIYEMRKENQRLVSEKLATSYRLSRLEKIRMLIAVCACQSYKNNLTAVESLIRQLVDVEQYKKLPSLEEMEEHQVFGQPLTDSIAAIEIGQYLQEKGRELETLDWTEVVGKAAEFKLELATGANPVESAKGSLPDIILSSKILFGEDVALELGLDGDQVAVTAKEPCTTVVNDWLRGVQGVNVPNKKVAALLHIYLLTFDVGGRAELDINDDGGIRGYRLIFDGDTSVSSEQNNSQGYDWIDDLLILSS